MVLRDLVNNEQGKAYIVNCKSGKIKEIDCAILSAIQIRERYGQYYFYYGNVHRDYNIIMFSKNKTNNKGYRAWIMLNNMYCVLPCKDLDLDKTSYLWCERFLITVSRDAAYNYAKKSLHDKMKVINSSLLKIRNSFSKLSNTDECQTFKDLINNKRGKAYLVHSKNPQAITEINCTICNYETIINKYDRYFDYRYQQIKSKHIFIRLSKRLKYLTKIGGDWNTPYIVFNEKMFGSKFIKYFDYYIFLSKKDAYDYVDSQIFKKKKEINDEIIKIIEEKFNIVPNAEK